MKYSNAQQVLPDEIVKLIQEYIDGGYLYIPRKEGEQRSWGVKTGARESNERRNKEIYHKYKSGATVIDLTETYFLSEKSIRRIIGEQRKNAQSQYRNMYEIERSSGGNI